jgi:hypothetical protein
MKIPEVPAPTRIDHITPSLYEELLVCPAKVTWASGGDRNALPPHPMALLGVAFHGVMEAAQRAELGENVDLRRRNARELFDHIADSLHAEAHPLLRVKFPATQKLPYYNLVRERVALLASEAEAPPPATTEGAFGSPARLSERRFSSADGTIAGRPDLVDVNNAEVIDYKAGQGADDATIVTDREARQLRLYAYLAHEAGIDIRRGTVVRGEGTRVSIQIPKETAEEEAVRARQAMVDYNASIERSSFAQLARPVPDSCRVCRCIPLCEAFWEAADCGWFAESSVHCIEGTVVELEEVTMQGVPVATLGVEVRRGTSERGTASFEQVPVSWFEADGDRGPTTGDVVRIVNGHVTHLHDPMIVRPDRTMTSIWRVEGEHGSRPSGADSHGEQ